MIDLVELLQSADEYQIMNTVTGEFEPGLFSLKLAKEFAQDWANGMRVNYAVVNGPNYNLNTVFTAKPARRRARR